MEAVGVIVTAGATAALVWSVRVDSRYRILWKPLASTGFLVVALAGGLPDDLFGRLLVAGLVCSFAGDVALLGSSERSFLAGLGAFLLAHIAYGGAFWVAGQSAAWAVPSLLVLAGVGALVGRWLLPAVTEQLRIPVVGYMVAISLMFVTAWGATGAGASPWIPLGAGLFYLSDLAVARQQFVSPGFVNQAWGLPVYYAAQVVLASLV